MKKLFAALASAALVGTVFAQTGVPASAMQPQAEATKDQVKVVKEKSAGVQGDVEKAQASAGKEKTDAKAGAKTSVAKATHHKASKVGAANTETGKAKAGVKKDADLAKSKADVAKPQAQPDAAKAAVAANVDNTKKQ